MPVPAGGGFCVDLVSPHTARGALLNDVVIGLPALLFLAYLALHARSSLRRLRAARSHMMASYYAAAWAVAGLAVGRAVLLADATPSGVAAGALNALWLVTRLGMTLLEASVVVFLLQGHLAPGAHALARTLGLSGGLAAADAALEAVLLWGHGVPLFLYGGPGRGGDMAAAKWAYWGIRSATCAAVYALLLALPRTRWRDALPARPAFYRYAAQMAGVHGLAAVGAALLAAGAGAGYCAVGTANVAYFAAYPVLLYATFLADFFRDAALDLDLAMFSEMQDAGFLAGGDDEGF